MMQMTATPPYYAVIFSSELLKQTDGYESTALEMVEPAKSQAGFLGMESIREENGKGITVSYWKNLADIKEWKAHSLHLAAQSKGKSEWYDVYQVRVCQVEKQYGFSLCGK